MADNKKEYFNIKGMKVSNVRRIPGTDVITFSLNGNGLGLYNLRIVTGGATGKFISPPSKTASITIFTRCISALQMRKEF